MDKIFVEYPETWGNYQLLDSGGCKKLERFGDFRIIRPDPRAIWLPSLPESEWHEVLAQFSGRSKADGKWQKISTIPDRWEINWQDFKFLLKFSDFKNIGIFPEQASNWEWLRSALRNPERSRRTEDYPLRVLNLFAYTGAASVVCAKFGAEVTHVDSVKSINSWAKENAKLNAVSEEQIRFLEDDVLKFVMREAKRGNKYDGIIMDPPRFGHGIKGEIWKLAFDLPKLVFESQKILSLDPVFFLINAYTADLSSIALKNLLENVTKKFGGKIESGELVLKEKSAGRLLPSGIFARWQR
ncbi:MAG: hypothetical protein A2418_00490 [Candidatus Brennerbacteria bacterium RIFOXYC1_FULL_41_11]|nr:MAG: hypothetical protein A2391_01950 [Candidatus Brennerbacteria bacterium RIFOXYB1_FULL_41_13]OGY39713.1 MAG: hypothetical protein A2418_00490 [Candidatus Brennerbacteria bacterium RIFOXYC1_FULL_41_11]